MERKQKERNTKAMQELPVVLKEILGENFNSVEGLNQDQMEKVRAYQRKLSMPPFLVTGEPIRVLNNMLTLNDADKNLVEAEKSKAIKMANEGTLNSEVLKTEFSPLAQIDFRNI